MAIHPDLQSMLYESIPEMLLVAKYCIETEKDITIWPAPGCYGYPAALILLSIADSIGSYVEQGKVANHFRILNNRDFYGLDLSDEEVGIIYDKYRNLLVHNTVISTNVGLNIGSPSDSVLQKQDGRFLLNLVPLYNATRRAVNSFLNSPEILAKNTTILNIYKKS